MDKYEHNKNPKCPYCDCDIDIHDNNLYLLYQEDEHIINCPECGKKIAVYSISTWAFSTSKIDNYFNDLHHHHKR